MSAPRWAARLVPRAATDEQADDVVGDLEEAHVRRAAKHGSFVAALLTGAEALDLARGLLWERVRARGVPFSLIDFELGVRMLLRYPGLTVMGTIALAFGIAVGTAWMVWYGISTAEKLGAAELTWIAGYAVLMLLICMIACVVPARRALRIQPKDALADAG